MPTCGECSRYFHDGSSCQTPACVRLANLEKLAEAARRGNEKAQELLKRHKQVEGDIHQFVADLDG